VAVRPLITPLEASKATMAEPNPATTGDGSRTKAPPKIEVKVSWCKGCGLCVDYCNRGVLEMKGELPVVLAAQKCTRCMLCEAICPDFAITVTNGSEQLGTGPEESAR
jgi:2-oxoglutarate ferredoxin oxidoreductase subunit delta